MRNLQKSDFHVGQKVYLLWFKNKLNPEKIGESIREATVTSVGRKYVAVDCYGRIEFDMTYDFREHTDGPIMWELYLSKSDIFEAVETAEVRRTVRNLVDQYIGLIPLEGLIQIESIIEKYKERI